jgi:teichuronic acid biosynthesis glycosyltransferase TuaC
MNILIVCSGTRGKISPFIVEQADALRNAGNKITYFIIKERGIAGYLKSWVKLNQFIKRNHINLIHAHYGLTGFICILQKKVPVIITFHGSDVNQKKNRFFSKIASRFSGHNIIVEAGFIEKLKLSKKYSVMPCGIDLNTFKQKAYSEARAMLGIKMHENIILFTSAFSNPVKNYPLAKKTLEICNTKTRLIELKGFTREDVSNWMNASDLLLLTSFSEGSPQVVKEAIACTLPVISTPVGDVVKISEETDGVTIIPYDARKIAEQIDLFFSKKYRIQNNKIVEKYDNKIVAQKITDLYKEVLNNQQ